jgi:hypothetical protein
MPTYCIPTLSGVPGFPANEFDWWTLPPNAASLRFSPDNPNWLGAFSLSEGAGANRDLQFRALRGPVGGQVHLFLSWVIRVSSLDTKIDRVNIVLGDGTNYIAFKVDLGSASTTVAGTQQNGIFSYRMHSCTVSAAGDITLVNPFLAESGADLEKTGRMWVDVTSPQRLLQTYWAFQVAIPLGVAWKPSLLNLPPAGAFKLWYEAWISVVGRTVPYQVPTNPAGLMTTSALDIIPAGLNLTNLLDMSTANIGCTDGVTLNWGNVGVRNVAATDPPRSGTTSIRLDLGQKYPPNQAAGGGPLYDVNHTPDVAQSKFQNQFFAQPTLPAGLSPNQQAALRGRFSLGNWGSQVAIPTASSWRPVPGGENVPYQPALPVPEMRFVWPQPTPPGGGPDPFTTILVRNINKYLNAEGRGTQIPADAQNPHQCVLVELSSTDPSVIITRSSIYQNMNVVSASVYRESAEISVVGIDPISPWPRDVYLYLQTFNMPNVVIPGPELESVRRVFDQGLNMAAEGRRQLDEVEDLAALFPTCIVKTFHDIGKTMKLEDGREVPILRPQTAFGYFAHHEGNLVGWATRLHGAIRLAENFYLLRVPNNGVARVDTVIQAIENANEPVDPEDPIVPMPPPLTFGGSERFFIGFFTHGGVASVENFPDRFVSPVNGYAYKQSEVRYEYYLHSTRLPVAGFVQGQRNPPDDADAGSGPGNVFLMLWNVDDSTGRVSLHTSYSLQRGEEERKETLTNDGCVKVYAVGQWASGQQHARVYYIEAPNMDPDVVRQIQQALSQNGVDPGPIDGDYGPKTAAAVAAFQAAHGLVANGEVGPETAQALGIQL